MPKFLDIILNGSVEMSRAYFNKDMQRKCSIEKPDTGLNDKITESQRLNYVAICWSFGICTFGYFALLSILQWIRSYLLLWIFWPSIFGKNRSIVQARIDIRPSAKN